jgi:hypothetical protein
MLQSEWTISRRELPRASLFTEVSGRVFSDIHPPKKICHLAHKKVPLGRRARQYPPTYFPHSSNKEMILPGAVGRHACECGHPEMRRLPDEVYWCPARLGPACLPRRYDDIEETPNKAQIRERHLATGPWHR